MAKIHINFGNVPSDTSLLLAQNEQTIDMAENIAHSLGLDHADHLMLYTVLVGSIAKGIDEFMRF